MQSLPSDTKKKSGAVERVPHALPLFLASGAQAVGIANISLKGRFLRSNQAFCDFVGYTQEELQKKTFAEITHPQDLVDELAFHTAAVNGSRKWYSMDKRYMHKKGHVVWAHIISSILPEVADGPYFLCIIEDIQKRHKEAAQEQENPFTNEIRVIEEYAIFHVSKQGIILSWNRGVQTNFGYSEEEFIGKEYSSLSITEHRILTNKELANADQNGKSANDQWRLRKDGSRVFMSGTTSAVHDSEGRPLGFTIVLHDDTQKKEIHDALLFESSHDPLTRLANRTVFDARLALALSIARRSKHTVAVLAIDIDKFKNINDTHGHSTGDAVLRELANRLCQVTREEDTVARLGGDEFIILLPVVTAPEQVALVAEKIISSLLPEVHVNGLHILLTASIGSSTFSRTELTAYDLVHSADMAMYQAKRSGGNMHVTSE